MPRSTFLLIVALLWACSGDSVPTTTTTAPPPATSPEQAVTGWLEAVAGGDSGATARFVSDRQLVLLIAVENQLTVEEIEQVVRSGISDDVRHAYWVSFRESFELFSGLGADALGVEAVLDISVDGEAFAAVEVAFPTRIGSTFIVTHQRDSGWFVDLIGTLGPSLIRPLSALDQVAAADPDAGAAQILLLEIAPSLRAALLRPDFDDLPVEFRSEVTTLLTRLGG